MTALDWYIVFAIGFAIFALWVVLQAEAARRRLREDMKRHDDSETRDAGDTDAEESRR